MRVGFSFSPGGLLLPYHLGVMDGLMYKGSLTETTPIAGASAGAIAVACHGCGLDSMDMIQATADLSESVLESGSQKLVQGLRKQMQQRIDTEQLQRLQERSGPLGIAYQQLFPQRRAILQTQFESVHDLTEAVCFSSTFPFFSSPFPCALDTRSSSSSPLPSLMVDGFFTVPRDRFGCPDLNHLEKENSQGKSGNGNQNQPGPMVDRTVFVSCLPQDAIGLTAATEHDCISPSISSQAQSGVLDPDEQSWELLRIATTPLKSGFQEYLKHYENGFRDAETWSARDQSRYLLQPSSGEAVDHDVARVLER